MQEEFKALLKDIKDIKIQGATAIAVESLKFLKKVLKKEGFGAGFRFYARKLEEARPTAVVLHNCLEEVRNDPKPETIDRLLKSLSVINSSVAKHHEFIKSGMTIMTHCHSSVLTGLLKEAKRSGKKFKVYIPMTEPKEQGVITSKELAAAKIPVMLIPDSAVSFYMPNIDMVVVGSDALREKGNVNKIGSFNIALAASKYKKPYYVVANTMKIDRREKWKIEMRNPNELHRQIRGVKMGNPAFDLTPWDYVYRVVTEKGIMTPENLKKMI